MKIINLSITCFTALTLIGCGASGTLDSTNNQDSSSNNDTNTSLSVTAERGPIYGATVKDANNKIAKNENSSTQNIYIFEETPTYPITVTGGYIDVDNNNIINTNDIALNVTLTSYSNIVSPLTTFVGNDNTKLDFIKNTYSLSDDDIKNTVPSETSSKTIILSNAIYKLLVNSNELNTSNLNTEYTTVNSAYNASFSGLTNLSALAISLENDTINNLSISKLLATDLTAVNEKLWGDKYIESLTLTNSTFTKTKKTTDDVSNIWNIGLDIPSNQSVSDFDIAVNIVKSSSGTIGNIIIEDISISNNKLTQAKKVSVFGKKTSGITSSISYDSSKEITKNAVSLLQGKLLIDLGYIISKQEVVSSSKFTNVSDYDVKIYITKLDTSNTATTSQTTVQMTNDSNITIPIGSQQIIGTIKVGN